MADRHWHWSFRIGGYTSMFSYHKREDAEKAMNALSASNLGSSLPGEVFEDPCNCGQPIVIEEK